MIDFLNNNIMIKPKRADLDDVFLALKLVGGLKLSRGGFGMKKAQSTGTVPTFYDAKLRKSTDRFREKLLFYVLA